MAFAFGIYEYVVLDMPAELLNVPDLTLTHTHSQSGYTHTRLAHTLSQHSHTHTHTHLRIISHSLIHSLREELLLNSVSNMFVATPQKPTTVYLTFFVLTNTYTFIFYVQQWTQGEI